MSDDIVQMLRTRNRVELTLDSGLKVAGHYPDIMECMKAGGLPLGIIPHLKKALGGQNGDGSSEDLDHVLTFNREIVKAFLDEIEGTPVEVTDDIVNALSPSERKQIVKLSMREAAGDDAEGKAEDGD